MRPTILIIRPEPEASRFAARLREVCGPGVEVLCAPVMRIVLKGELPPLAGDEVVIFTSRHGVAGFCRLTDRRDFPCYAVGTATAEAARAEGLRTITCGGDAAALLARIAKDGTGGPFLHPRGAHVATEIAAALRASGHEAAEVVVYDQVARPLSAAAHHLLAGQAPVILPLMSPRSGRLFFEQAGVIRAPLHVAAISDKAAQGIEHDVSVAKTPDLDGILTVVQGLIGTRNLLEGGKRAK